MKCVFFSSVDATDANLNLSKYIAIGKWAFYDRGVIPIMPHFNSLIIDLSTNEGALNGKLASKDMIFYANEMWVLGNKRDERIKEEIQLAKILKIRIRYFSNKEISKILKKYGGTTIHVK